MKLIIKFSYRLDGDYPFVANAVMSRTGESVACKTSDKSFEDARDQLVDELKRIFSRQKPPLPEDEEIEFD